jgi:choline-sulfatase
MNTKGIVSVVLTVVVAAGACRKAREPAQPDRAAARRQPSILLVTLDTTRADSIGPGARVDTPAFNALAARALQYRQAYATVPETLPSHTSMLTGLYPAGHGVHENARTLSPQYPVIAEQLQKAGYRTTAFVSSFVLARRFGLSRGFDVYADDMPAGSSEKTAAETTTAALAELQRVTTAPRFVWVHYFDPHAPYTPPEPYRSRYPQSAYLAEIASMDHELGRLLAAFEAQAARESRAAAIAVVGDHGEGLGDHGESQHGYLLYQATMHVPLVLAAEGVRPGTTDTPVSTRRIYHTVLAWAGLGTGGSLLESVRPNTRIPRTGATEGPGGASPNEAVLGESMKPFLEYGWQPQVMSIVAPFKSIMAGKVETYDITRDPQEQRNLGGGANVPKSLVAALDDYPLPSLAAPRTPPNLDEEARRRLASLGYVSAGATPLVRKDAPRPADMVAVMRMLDEASGLFVNEQYAAVIPLLESILAADPRNLDAMLRLATAHSALGHDAQAVDWFRRASVLAPRSPDVDLYLALHYARGREWLRAVPLLERIVADTPDRLPALEALAALRERQGRTADAVALRRQIYELRVPTAAELEHLGDEAMAAGQTVVATEAFEKARAVQGRAFTHDLELGVLYLASQRLQDAKAALDRVPSSSPGYPMALFKRAQVSALLGELDLPARIAAARQHADRTTAPLIASERLFR